MKTYFSFIGEVKCLELGITPNHGYCIYDVSGSDWSVSLFRGRYNQVYILDISGDWERWYVAKAESFECNPAVGCSSYSEELREVLGISN